MNINNKILVIGLSTKDHPKTSELIAEDIKQGATIVYVDDENKTQHEIIEQVKLQLGLVKLDKEVRENCKFILGSSPLPSLETVGKATEQLVNNDTNPFDDTRPPSISRERRYNKKRNAIQINKSSRGNMLGGGINKATGQIEKYLPEFTDSKNNKFIRKPNGQVVKVDIFPSEAVKQFNNSVERGDVKGINKDTPAQVVV